MEYKSLDARVIEEHQRHILEFEKRYGFKFLPPSYEKVPFVSKYFLTEPTNEKEKIIQSSIITVEDYLLESYPIDRSSLNLDDSGRKISDGFSSNHGEWFAKVNKLRNNVRGASGHGSILAIFYNYNDISDKLTAIHKINYSILTFQERVDLCRKQDACLYSLLERIYVDNVNSS